MPFNLLLFPLLAGFIFVTFWNRTKIRAARYEGYRLIFYSSIWGAVFLFLSILLLQIPYIGTFLDGLMSFYFEPFYSRYEGFDLAFVSFILGSVSWLPLNFIFRREREYAQAVKLFGSRFEKLLLRAIQNNSMVAVTLSNRKVYIGYVLEDINPENDRAFLTLFPMLSGYRSGEDLSVTITTNYAEIYQELMEDPNNQEGRFSIIKAYDFRICIKASDIVSINGYDTSIYNHFFKKSMS